MHIDVSNKLIRAKEKGKRRHVAFYLYLLKKKCKMSIIIHRLYHTQNNFKIANTTVLNANVGPSSGDTIVADRSHVDF